MKIEPRHHIQATGHLLAYYYPDLLYIRDFQRQKKRPLHNPNYANGSFRRFIVDFQVARCLDTKHENPYSELLTLTLEWVKQTPDDVDGFVNSLKMAGLAHDKKATSLVSKILFLNSPQTISPFDGRVTRAARQVADQKIKNYRDYLSFFTEFKKANIDEIESRLSFVEDYLLVIVRVQDIVNTFLRCFYLKQGSRHREQCPESP